jgi:GTP-binding protein
MEDARVNLDPLLDTILEIVPAASGDKNLPLQAQVFNLAYDNFLGRLSVARIYNGTAKQGQTIYAKDPDGKMISGKITKLFTYTGTARVETSEAIAGDIVVFAGIPDAYIGDTLVADQSTEALPTITVDEPTISLSFLVNDSPFAGREGKFVTIRQIRDRLEKELEVNVGLKVDFSQNDVFTVFGRGELHIAVLLENMRREGFELQVSQPKVIVKEEGGKKQEPYEELTIDVPAESSGAVIEKITKRRGMITNMIEKNGIFRINAEIPTRGLLGYRGEFVIDTKGLGILSSQFIAFKDWAGEIQRRDTGSMTTMASGKALAFSLWNLQERGVLYIPANVEVYEGQVIGNTAKGDEMTVNPTKGKQLTNMRSSGADEAINLVPAWEMTIERGLETMNADEYLEITPKSTRLRKKWLTETDRAKNKRN